MSVKSVIDIEVNDSAFKDFSKLFEKYQSALGATPGVWAKAEAATSGIALNVENLVAALLTHEAINKKIAAEEAIKLASARAQDKIEKDRLARAQRAYQGMTVPARDVAKSVASITMNLAKWATYGGLASGIVGFGGLIGLDRLANLTGSGRRTAQGLGTSYGGAKAFTNSYDRIIDSGSILGGVNDALTDPSKRAPLFAAGLTGADIAGGDAASISEKLIDSVKKLVDRTPTALLGGVAQARGLGQLGFSTEDLRRLKATSPEELRAIEAGARSKAGQFNVEDGIARKWQDLGVQLDSAKIKIEGVLVTGLEKLANPLGQLSDHVANALADFVKGLDQKTLDDIGKGVEDFGKYLGSPQFRSDIKDFATDVSYAAKKIVGALKWFGLIPDNSPQGQDDQNADAAAAKRGSAYLKAHPTDGTMAGYNAARYGANGETSPANRALGRASSAARDWLGDRLLGYDKKVLGEDARWSGRTSETNPGNIRIPGVGQGFAHFRDSDAGIRAIAKQIGLYEKRDHLDTLEKIIGRYAPGADKNDVNAYVKDVEAYTGIGRNQKLDANNQGQIAKIVAGITKHEGTKRYTADQVKVIIQNNTGGSAIVQSSQAAKQG